MFVTTKLSLLPAVLFAALLPSVSHATVMPVNPGAFPLSSTLITFTGLPDGTEVNGLSVSGVLFSYSLGDGNVQIDGGPGITNNVNPPNVVSMGDNSGTLTLTLPGTSTLFGYGYAILSASPEANATSITLFNNATNIGTLSYDGVLDPNFAGGFAGIQSTLPFNRVQLTFDSVAAPAFALDNVTFDSATAVPEPSVVWLTLTGTVLLLFCESRRRIRQRVN